MAGRILISGAGIAGCCLAWWLQRYGYSVTVVEQAAAARDGGYVIDFWGLGYDVADKMGLLDELRRHDLDVDEFRVVDDRGRRTASINQRALQELTRGRIMSLPRSAVATALFDAIKNRVDVRFGDSVTALTETPREVEVQFRSGGAATFDLVIGADGLHSNVRRLVFGDGRQFERFLGYYVAAFTAPNYPHRNPHIYVTYGEPGRQIWRISLKHDAAVFLLVFAHNDTTDIPMHEPARQKEVLTRLYGRDGWEAKDALSALQATTEVYFDRVSQIAMPQWSKGRVALIGDACACPSLLAGEGSAMAMAEAYTLAGEVDRAAGDHIPAFAAYERRLRPYVERKQKGARAFAASFVPKSNFGLWLRNVSIDTANRLGLAGLLFGTQINDRIALENYRQP